MDGRRLPSPRGGGEKEIKPYAIALASIARRVPEGLESAHGIGGQQLEREQRRLAAIVAADVIGCSRLMGRARANEAIE